ncbi:MAG: hypothetical protein R3261_02230 [Alphaproteobacteria bacterium]|nr:hypothetical protein [Alphaproteobacteria bacterium]
MPSAYQLRIQILNDGRFAYEYEGDLIHLRFLSKLGQKEIEQGSLEETEWSEIYRRDLARDEGFQSIRYKGEARFAVRYRFEGNINELKSYHFVRRNAWFMRIARTAPGVVELSSNKLPENYRKELEAGGFISWGRVRVWTDANVTFDNAIAKSGSGTVLYEWAMRSNEDELPKMVIGIIPQN